MLTFIASCFRRALCGEILGLIEPKSASKFIHRDELSNKKSPSKQKSYYGDSLSCKKPLLIVKDEKEMVRSSTAGGFDGKARSAVIRVKVKMTRQEAARLLSKCKDGGVLEFRDVARELVGLPMNRVAVVSTCPAGSNLVLDSIPEE